MLNLKHFFKGDTLIEVTIAIGIFTLVAVSVVAVVNISTSGAQSALENTLTREEIDTQAEAIRFIQSTYNPDNVEGEIQPNTKEGLYQALWLRLKSLAEANSKYGLDESIVSFDSETCSSVYDNNNELLKKSTCFHYRFKKIK